MLAVTVWQRSRIDRIILNACYSPFARGEILRNSLLLVLLGSCALSGCGGGSSPPPPPPLTISTTSLPNGTFEIPYSQTIQASGGVAPFTWTVSAGALPQNLTLSSGETNTVTISGTPETAIQAGAFTIEVRDSANQSATQPYTVSIVLEPDTLTLSATSLNFAPPQLIGTMSGAQTMMVTNTGSSEVVISNIALTGANAADFSQNNTCGSSLAAGANCTIHVTFTPSQPGPRSASITITNNTTGSPQSVALTGTGMVSGPNATLLPATLSISCHERLDPFPVCSCTANQVPTLSDFGSTELRVTSIATSGPFSESNTCGTSLGAGDSCTIDVEFSSRRAETNSGTLLVTDNAPGSPQEMILTETGTCQ
jgi:trimeric autotransporter adhesin